MKVQYLVQHFSAPETGRGGRAFEACRRLAGKGHHVDLLAARRPEGEKGWKVAQRDGFSTHLYPVAYSQKMSPRQRIRSFSTFAAAAAHHARRLPADVVLASSTPLTVAIPGVYSSRGRGAFVFEVRDLWPEMPIAMGALRNPFQIAVAKRLETWAYQNADHLIAASGGMADGVAAHGYPRERISVIPNASDIDDFQADDGEAFREAHPELSGKALVLFAGSLGPLYEPLTMVKYAERFHAISDRLMMVVIGSGSQKQVAASAAETAGILGKSIIFLDPLPRPGIISAFRASQVVLSIAVDVPGIEHNSANKFFDGLAAGKPVAVNYGGWQARLLEEREAGLSLSRDATVAANQIAELALDEEASATFGRNALQLAEDKFARALLVDELEAVLLSAAALRGR